MVNLPSRFFFMPLFIISRTRNFLRTFIIIISSLRMFNRVVRITYSGHLSLRRSRQLKAIMLLFIRLSLIIFDRYSRFLRCIIYRIRILLMLNRLQVFLIRFNAVAIRVVRNSTIRRTNDRSTTIVVHMTQNISQSGSVQRSATTTVSSTFHLRHVMLRQVKRVSTVHARRFTPIMTISRIVIMLLLITISVQFLSEATYEHVVTNGHRTSR